MMYAQWGNTALALDWLEVSSRARNADLDMLKQNLAHAMKRFG
jgi:hypothetical protein